MKIYEKDQMRRIEMASLISDAAIQDSRQTHRKTKQMTGF